MHSAEISLDGAGQSFIFYVLSDLDMGGGKRPCDIVTFVFTLILKEMYPLISKQTSTFLFRSVLFVPNTFTGVFMVFFHCQCNYATPALYSMHLSYRILRWQLLLWLNIEQKSRLFRASLKVGSSFSVLWKVFCQINFAAAPFC